MAPPPRAASGQGQDAVGVKDDRERLAIQECHVRPVIVPANQLVVGGCVVVENDVTEGRNRPRSCQHQVVRVQLVHATGLGAGHPGENPTAEVGVRDLGEVAELGIGRHGSVGSGRQGDSERVTAKVMDLLGQGLGEGVELIESGHGRLVGTDSLERRSGRVAILGTPRGSVNRSHPLGLAMTSLGYKEFKKMQKKSEKEGEADKVARKHKERAKKRIDSESGDVVVSRMKSVVASAGQGR